MAVAGGSPTPAGYTRVLANVPAKKGLNGPSPGGQGLRIREVDGAPSGVPVILELPNGTLTDVGGGVYRYTPGDATLANGYVSRLKMAAGVGVYFGYSQPGASGANSPGTDNVIAAVATTRYRNIIDQYGCTGNATEANTQRRVLWPRTMVKLKLRITALTGDATLTLTVRKNGADTALTKQVAAGSGAQYVVIDAAEVGFVEGDLVDLMLVSGAGATFNLIISEVEVMWRDT